MRALVATFIMAEILDPSQYFSSPYHVSSQQHMICSIGTQQEREIFCDQSKIMNDTNRSSFGRRYTSNVCSHCGRTEHVIDTCYRRHSFPPQFKFKNHKADCNNNQQNHEGSRSEVRSQHIGFTPEQYQTLLTVYNSLNPVTMSLIKYLVFLPTQQHTLVINFFLSLVLGLLIVVLLIIFVHP